MTKNNKGDFTPQIITSVAYKQKNVVFSAEVNSTKVQFLYGESEKELTPIGTIQDYTILSDDIAKKFNGVYIGMYATSSGQKSKNTAHFDWFEYQKLK